MKPFDLKKYLTNPSRKIVTKDGRPVRIICTDRKTNYTQSFPIVALILNNEGTECIYTYDKTGMRTTVIRNNLNDLFFAPEKKEGWINIYSDTIVSRIYPSEEEAKENICYGAVATVKIEWEE